MAVLNASDGNDLLVGGPGDDLLIGGAGADTFYFASTYDGIDFISDFTPGDGDVLDLSDVLVDYQSGDDISLYLSLNSTVAGDQQALSVDPTGTGTFTDPLVALNGTPLGDLNDAIAAGTIKLDEMSGV